MPSNPPMSLPSCPSGSEDAPIAQKVHRMWFGGEPPIHVQNNWKLWEERLPDFEFVTWTEDNLDEFPAGRRIFEETRHQSRLYQGITNFLRIWTVALYGGMYVDCDAVPLFDQEQWKELNAKPWFAHISKDAPTPSLPWNGMFNLPAKHPILSEVWEYGQRRWEKGVTRTHNITGPQGWHKVWQKSPFNVEMDKRYYFLTAKNLRRKTMAGTMTQADLDDLHVQHPDLPAAHIGFVEGL